MFNLNIHTSLYIIKMKYNNNNFGNENIANRFIVYIFCVQVFIYIFAYA